MSLDQELMEAFAQSTGVTGIGKPRRYLWTDAFAVCNYLGLAQKTGEEKYLEFARGLVDQVHRVLGRHRGDDGRTGWISGLSEDEGARFPTRGGLRIGKKLPERQPGEPFDRQLEWERDGQYFHYLTKWAHALALMGSATREEHYLRWAVELIVVSQRRFTLPTVPGEPGRLAWKMSIDLTRPLVASTGQHDALDGFITSLELGKSRGWHSAPPQDLSKTLASLSAQMGSGDWVTEDPLGIGGVLDAATRLAMLIQLEKETATDLLSHLVQVAVHGLRGYAHSHGLNQPATHRLAFRELGLAIGLQGLEWVASRDWNHPGIRQGIQDLARFQPLAGAIRDFWCQPANRAVKTWMDHDDINSVMLVTSLYPWGFLNIG